MYIFLATRSSNSSLRSASAPESTPDFEKQNALVGLGALISAILVLTLLICRCRRRSKRRNQRRKAPSYAPTSSDRSSVRGRNGPVGSGPFQGPLPPQWPGWRQPPLHYGSPDAQPRVRRRGDRPLAPQSRPNEAPEEENALPDVESELGAQHVDEPEPQQPGQQQDPVHEEPPHVVRLAARPRAPRSRASQGYRPGLAPMVEDVLQSNERRGEVLRDGSLEPAMQIPAQDLVQEDVLQVPARGERPRARPRQRRQASQAISAGRAASSVSVGPNVVIRGPLQEEQYQEVEADQIGNESPAPIARVAFLNAEQAEPAQAEADQHEQSAPSDEIDHPPLDDGVSVNISLGRGSRAGASRVQELPQGGGGSHSRVLSESSENSEAEQTQGIGNNEASDNVHYAVVEVEVAQGESDPGNPQDIEAGEANRAQVDPMLDTDVAVQQLPNVIDIADPTGIAAAQVPHILNVADLPGDVPDQLPIAMEAAVPQRDPEEFSDPPPSHRRPGYRMPSRFNGFLRWTSGQSKFRR